MRKKKSRILLCMAVMICILAAGCGNKTDSEPDMSTSESEITAEINAASAEAEPEQEEQTESEETAVSLEDGIYSVKFDTDGSMFHVSEACEGRGTLTVKDGNMMIHISLPSKNVVNLFPGLAEDAEKEGAELLMPTIDTVTYSDGITEEVHGFDIPVTVLDEEFDVALLGTKGKWYDHKVIVSDPVKQEETVSLDMEDGEYDIDVTLEGGSGRASVLSPAKLFVQDGASYVRIEWSSPNYDYMVAGDKKYLPVNKDGNSVFEIPVSILDKGMSVTADTTAMGTPHEIEYMLTFHADTIKKQ